METPKVNEERLEIEQKYRVKSPQQILDRAKELKVEFAHPLLERDMYFDRLNAAVLAVTDEVLRLRSCGSWYGPTEPPLTPIMMHSHVLTFKGQKIENSQGIKVRPEVELFVHDVQDCCTILWHLGYTPILSFEKVRRLAKCAVTTPKANSDEPSFAIATGFHIAVNHVECTICLDSLDKDNHFLEIECCTNKDKADIAMQAIEYVAKMFQVEEKEQRSYPQIVRDING